MPRLSVLDLSPIIEGGDAGLAFRNTADLAQHAELWGYHRYWLAEHHNLPGIASAATSVVIAHVAGQTKTIRVGAGGIMLPNHAPLIIAEQFGTLESLYPGRIDLGLGRAPGSDQRTARALRRNLGSSGDTFPQDVIELQSYFAGTLPVRAVPGSGLTVPLYLLGSSDFSARLAAELGLPFAFASHFAPDYLEVALHLYRRDFQPSAQLDKPYVMIGAGVFAAETDAEARRLFSSAQLQFLKLVRGRPGELPPPVDSIDDHCTPAERAAIDARTRCSPSARRKQCAAASGSYSKKLRPTKSSPPAKFTITPPGSVPSRLRWKHSIRLRAEERIAIRYPLCRRRWSQAAAINRGPNRVMPICLSSARPNVKRYDQAHEAKNDFRPGTFPAEKTSCA